MSRTYNKFKGVIWLLPIFVILLFFPVKAHGESLDSFDAVIHPSDHQIDKEQLYYDLLYKPGESEKLAVTLTNRGDQPLKIKASFNRAITNNGGVIEYSGMNKDTSNFAPYDIEKLVALSDAEISLAPKESKEIYLTVKMPEKEFSGVLAGGLYLEEQSDEKIEGNIRNVFSREIAVLLRNDQKEVVPDLKISGAKAAQLNARNAVEVSIENPQAVYVKDVTVDYKIVHDKETIVEGQKKQMSIAPSTLFNFMILMDGKEFTSGTYSAEVKVTAGDKQWQENPSFTINQQKAESYNKSDVSVASAKPDIPWLWIGAAIILVFAAVVVIFILVNRNKKLKKELQKNRRKKARRKRNLSSTEKEKLS